MNVSHPKLAVDFVELHCHSHFSLLDGASPPEALVARAAELGMPALALTDHDALYGAVQFGRAARTADRETFIDIRRRPR